MRSIIAMALVCGLAASAHADPNVIVLKNAHVLRELRLADGCWRTTRLARADGSDALTVKSDEFHILPLGSKTGWTVADYQAAGPPERDGATSVRITYRPRKPLPPAAPTQVAVSYTLDASPYLRKSIVLTMAKGQAVDRLQVERFSTATPASRGGRGEPVFAGDSWFFGLQYPAARNRHSNDYASRPYAKFGNYSWIGADGRDEEFAPRPGLITLAHFPGLAKEEGGAQWVIRSKTSVAGVGRKGDTLELAFMDYLATIRRPVRSFVHYNNWYDASGKDLSIPNFVDTLTASFLKNLKPYGVTVHAMVPDNGWQNKASIWQPSPRHFPKGMDDLAALGKALAAKGSGPDL